MTVDQAMRAIAKADASAERARADMDAAKDAVRCYTLATRTSGATLSIDQFRVEQAWAARKNAA